MFDRKEPKSRLRLLMLTDTPIVESGGSERFLRNLLGLLSSDCYTITLVQLCIEPIGADRLHEQPKSSHLRVLYFPVTAVYGFNGIRAYWALRRLVQQEGFHIIQSQHEKSDILNAFLPRGPLNAIRISNRRDTGFQKSWRLRKLFRALNSSFDHIVAPANAILELLAREEAVSRARMHRIPNGVDCKLFQPAASERRTKLRNQLGFSNQDFLIGCVAAFTAVKRHGALIDAFVDVRSKAPQARLLLIGDGPLRDEIADRIKLAGIGSYVCLYGNSSDVAELLSALDVFVLASSTEGMSNAILEAMACGLAVVATDVGGNRELVDDGCTGLLVPAGDTAALSVALARLSRDSGFAHRCGIAARKRVLSDFSLTKMAQGFENLYCESQQDRGHAT